MRVVTRTIAGPGRHHSAAGMYYEGAPHSVRPAAGRAAAPVITAMDYTQAGPVYRGMDPSDPSTYTRPWNPAPGMIAQLNFDGAMMQGRTPTQIRRGSQTRPLRLRMAGR